MPIRIRDGHPSICIRRTAFERAGLSRAELDSLVALTDDEFSMEKELVVVGPLFGDGASALLSRLESAGLEYFDDYFELSGNWPSWLDMFAMHRT